MDAVARYLERLKDARGTGEAHEYRHLDGWRSAHDNAICYLYTQGKASVAQAMTANAKPLDHILALDNRRGNEGRIQALEAEQKRCTDFGLEKAAMRKAYDKAQKELDKLNAPFFALCQELVAASVDIVKLEWTRQRMLEKLGHTLTGPHDRTTIAQAQSYAEKMAVKNVGQRRPVMVTKATGANGGAARVKTKAPTADEIAIAAMREEGNKIIELTEQLKKLKMMPKDVTDRLSEEEIAAMTARMNAKGKDPVVK